MSLTDLIALSGAMRLQFVFLGRTISVAIDFKKHKSLGKPRILKVVQGSIPIFEYIEQKSKKHFAIAEALLHAEDGDIRINLHEGIHFKIWAGKLEFLISPFDLASIFKYNVQQFDVLYTTEETFRKHMETRRNKSITTGLSIRP